MDKKIEGSVTLTLGQVIIHFKNGKRFVATGQTMNPAGIFAIGSWDKSSLTDGKEPIETTKKMLFFPFELLGPIVFDMVENQQAGSKSEVIKSSPKAELQEDTWG